MSATTKKLSERIQIVAEPSFVRRMEKAASRLGVGMSAYIRIAVNEKIDREERNASDTAKK